MLCCAETIQVAVVFECGESKDGPCGMLGGAASRSAITEATSEAILDAKQMAIPNQVDKMHGNLWVKDICWASAIVALHRQFISHTLQLRAASTLA